MHELDAIFRPQSIAVIGASKHRGKIGWEIVHNIIRYGFEGKVFPDPISSIRALSYAENLICR